MALDSSSTLAEIEAQYDDNADYAETSSVAKARLFSAACRMLLRRYRTSVNTGGFSQSRSVDIIREEQQACLEWTRQYDAASNRRTGPRVVSLEDFRA